MLLALRESGPKPVRTSANRLNFGEVRKLCQSVWRPMTKREVNALGSACDGRGAKTPTAAGIVCHRHRQQPEKRHRQQQEQRLRRQQEQRLRRQQQQLLQRKGRVRSVEWPERQRAQSRESSGTTLAQTPSVCLRHGPEEEEEEVPEDRVGQEVLEAHHRHRQERHFGHLQQDVCQDEKKVASTRDCWRSRHHSAEKSDSGDVGK